MENETSKKGSTLILGRPFLMTTRTKIDVHAGTLLMEFRDNLVQFNIFDAMRHPTEDHSLCSMDIIDEIVEEYNQFDSSKNNMTTLVEISNMLEGVGYVMGDVDATHLNGVLNRPNSDNHVCKKEDEPKYSISTRVQVAEITRPIISKGAINVRMDVAS
ncbi:hypothetical protein CR513_47827, partial [Mucuna pruriens]